MSWELRTGATVREEEFGGASPPLGKESITQRSEAGFRARGRRVRMTGAGNQEHAETVGLGLSIISPAQLWPEPPAHMERFLDLTFLVVRRNEAQVTECWCPDEAVKKELMAFSSV